MSADNGVYIARFTDNDFRVIHAQAIDSLFYPNGPNAYFIWKYYRYAKPFTSMDAVMKEAIRIEEEIEWTEYGIVSFAFEHPFSAYEEAAKDNQYDVYRCDESED